MKKERLLMTENRTQKTCKKHFLSTRYLLLATLILVWLILPQEVAWAEWIPPIGIPKPEFGIEETYRMYDDESNRNPALNYTQNSEGGYYTHYVDNTDPDATDTDNPYGTASVPRLTLPTQGRYPTDPSKWLAEGSVVEVHGGPYDLDPDPVPPDGVSVYSNASSAKPVFIRGVGSPVIHYRMWFLCGQYLVVEGFEFDDTTVWVPYSWGVPIRAADYVSIRNNEFIGDGEVSGYGGVAMNGSTGDVASYIVVYDNHIHSYGKWDWIGPGGDENDAMGVNVMFYSEHVWVVDNHIHHNGGDSVHVGNDANRTSRYVYIGRNDMHDDRENAIDVKEAQDVIISQNTMHSYLALGRPDDGTIAGTHEGTWAGNDCPKDIWYIFNEMYDATDAAHASHTGDGLYFIGNLIHDIPATPGDPAHSKAIMPFNFQGSERHYYIGNTMYNVEAGIIATVDSPDASIVIANNIFDSLSEGTGAYWQRHIWIDNNPDTATLDNNLFYQEGGEALITWDDTTYNLGEMQSLFGEGLDCIEGDPQFIDPANGDFHLQPTSPAIDAGTSSGVVQEVFDRFEQLYGIDIRKDIEGRTRPQGSAWDIGAYEYVLFPVSIIQNEPKEGHAPLTVSFDGSQSTSPHGDIVSYEWDFGDGSTSTGMKTSHIFTSAGEYTVTLTVTDDLGLKGESQTRITVFEKEFGELPAGCYNNVFNPAKGERALIVVELSKQAHVRLNLYNTRGKRIRELADEEKEAGTHKYYWDGKSGNGDAVGSGLYFVHIQAGDYKKTKKIVVVK